MKRLAYIIGGALTLFLAAVVLWPANKCGEVGYYPKLSATCRAAQIRADADQYCTIAERRDIACAAATFADARSDR